ncbi:hypothetical protein [Salinibacter grassmerensis]|uniref:hypothetical protein n=1 Tax=Salinibacter grassmerensis TaxID=3040353 RepID=UPI0021E80D0F|nr:hypothetical protein [Salinibacter grassmerensis]
MILDLIESVNQRLKKIDYYNTVEVYTSVPTPPDFPYVTLEGVDDEVFYTDDSRVTEATINIALWYQWEAGKINDYGFEKNIENVKDGFKNALYVSGAEVTDEQIDNVNRTTFSGDGTTEKKATITLAYTIVEDRSADAVSITSDKVIEGENNLYFTQERTQDAVDSLLEGGEGITLAYDDESDSLTVTADDISFEVIQDKAWDVLTGTQTLIDVTYDDSNDEVDFEIESDLSQYDNSVSGFISGLSNFATGDLAEGSNLYFTEERVDDRVSNLVSGGTHVIKTYTDSNGNLTLDVDDNLSAYNNDIGFITGYTVTESDVTQHEGALTITESQISDLVHYTSSDFDTDFSNKSSDNLSEGINNLYFTEERAQDAANSLLSGGTNATLSHDDAGNTLTVNVETDLSEYDNSTTGYISSVSEAAVTQHETALTVTESQISDLDKFTASDIPATYMEEGENVSLLNNDAGFISGYTVTESDVTQHEAALTVTESQISDLTHYTDEEAQDAVNSLLTGGSNVALTYDDAGNSLTIDGTDTTYSAGTLLSLSGTEFNVNDDLSQYDNTTSGFLSSVSESAVTQHESALTITESQISDLTHYTSTDFGTDFSNKTTDALSEGTSNLYYTDERVEDHVASVLSGGTNASVTRDDANNAITVSSTDTQLTSEEVQDAVYNNVLTGTQSLISVAYDDANRNVSYEVTSDLSQFDNSTSGFITGYTVTQSDVTQHETALTITESQISDLTHYGSTDFDSDFGSKTTDGLSEGTSNLYYTTERAQDDAASLLSGGTNASVTYDDAAPSLTVDVDDNLSTYTNDAGFITGYTVTETDVTQHESALTVTESQISDLTHYTDEDAQDAANSLLTGGSGIGLTYDDANNSLTVDGGIGIEDSATSVLSRADGINFGRGIAVTDDGDNSASVKAHADLQGRGVPSNSLGENGDIYFDTRAENDNVMNDVSSNIGDPNEAKEIAALKNDKFIALELDKYNDQLVFAVSFPNGSSKTATINLT